VRGLSNFKDRNPPVINSTKHRIVVPNVDQAIEFSNDYAPEHLILHLENASPYPPLITQGAFSLVHRHQKGMKET